MNAKAIRRIFFLAVGWIVLACGVLVMPVPVPLPFPAGPILIMIGSAILTTHSKPFRRAVQRLRHRYGWLSRVMDKLSVRAPRSVKTMVGRTNPLALERQAKSRTPRAEA